MTDLDLDLLLDGLNADLPAMTDEAFEVGRARLPGVTDSGAVPVPSPVAVVTELPRSRPLRSTPRRRFVQLAAAALAAAAAVATGVVLVQDSGPVTPASVTTPEQLAAWAQGLADDSPVVQPGQFRYQKTAYSYAIDLNGNPAFRPQTDQTWELWKPYDYRDEWMRKKSPTTITWLKGNDADARTAGYVPDTPQPGTTETGECGWYSDKPPLKMRDNPRMTTGPDGDAWVLSTDEDMVPDDPCTGDGWMWAGSPEFYEGLSGDPQRLYDILRERAGDGGPGPSVEWFVMAGQLLDANLSGEFKSTLYQAMSRIPGLVVLDDQRTEDGQTGIGVRVADGESTYEWVLDRETGDVLELDETTSSSRRVMTYHYGVADSLGGAPRQPGER